MRCYVVLYIAKPSPLQKEIQWQTAVTMPLKKRKNLINGKANAKILIGNLEYVVN